LLWVPHGSRELGTMKSARRSPIVVAGYLMSLRRSLEGALAEVKRARDMVDSDPDLIE
jgi:hypothetical protein